MANYEKIQITGYANMGENYFYFEQLSGTAAEVIARIQAIIDLNAGKTLCMETDVGDSWSGPSVVFTTLRLETDEEFTKRTEKLEAARIKQEAAAKAKKEALKDKEYKEFLRLQKKFGT